jgi:hypothetical protein
MQLGEQDVFPKNTKRTECERHNDKSLIPPLITVFAELN